MPGASRQAISTTFATRPANAAAIYQMTPIVVMLMSAVLLREAIPRRGWLGALLGFSGMLLVVRPDGEMLNPHALAVVAAVLLSGLRDLLMRGRGGVSASPFCLGVFSAICAMVLGFATAGDAGVLVPASGREILLLLLAAGGIAVGYVFLALGTSIGNSGFVSPFRYSMLIYAVIFGALVMGDLPDGLALTGVALIVAGGVVVSAPPDLWLRALTPLRCRRRGVVRLGGCWVTNSAPESSISVGSSRSGRARARRRGEARCRR